MIFLDTHYNHPDYIRRPGPGVDENQSSTVGVASTNGTTTTQYDLLGRPTTVTTYDNSSTTTDSPSNSTGTVATVYFGNQTTVEDQANNQRQSFTDGLGRLTQVNELQPVRAERAGSGLKY